MAKTETTASSKIPKKNTLSIRARDAFLSSAETKRDMAEAHADTLAKTARAIVERLQRGGKILICGNGGSAADAQHLAAELIGRYRMTRAALPAVALTTDTSVLTCIGNDFGFDDVFARQVEGLGASADVLIAISTSGNSPNVLRALAAASDIGMFKISFTGAGGGRMKRLSDITVDVPSNVTPRIQESHGAAIHILCELIEALLFPEV
jgi:D-sedoheptulose 7-phosphate isomerase